MWFDEELESLEIEAYRELKAIPHEELTRSATSRATGAGTEQTEATEAIGAVIDFREHRRSDALGWARGFVTRFIVDIRTQICGQSGQKLGAVAGITPRTAAQAVAAWIVASFGVANPVAFAMATLVVLVLARALRTAFCSMSEQDIKLALHAAG